MVTICLPKPGTMRVTFQHEQSEGATSTAS